MRYALINTKSKVVEDVIELDENSDWPVPKGYLVVASDEASPGWSYIDKTLIAPVIPVVVPPPEEILAANQATLANLQAAASQAMTPLLVSLQLGDATEEETASARAWQAYTRALKVLDLTVSDPEWPSVPA